MQSLLNHQAYELRDDYWEQDVASLLCRFENFGCNSSGADIHYPRPHIWPKELSQSELAEALERLSQWRPVASQIPGKEPNIRTELVRTYQFDSFEDIMRFMVMAAPFISNMNHHPRWENIYASLTVALTSWDIGFKPSRFDIELATHLDRLFRNFVETGQQGKMPEEQPA